MFSIVTLPLALIAAVCAVVLLLHGRLTAKLDRVQEAGRRLEPLLRRRMDILFDIAERLGESGLPENDGTAFRWLRDLCESGRDAERDYVIKIHASVMEAWRPLQGLAAQQAACDPDGAVAKLCGVLAETDAPLKENGQLYNEAAAPYNEALSKQPYAVLAGLFLLKQAEPFIITND